jgi:hypothetical protein
MRNNIATVFLSLGLFCICTLVANFVHAELYGVGLYGNCDYGYEDECTISITTDGVVNLNSVPNASGLYTTSSDDVLVDTNSFAGYTLTLSNNSATDNALISGGNDIPAHSGTVASPSDLAINTWGFRIDDLGGFGSGPSSAITDQASTTMTFAGVPLSGSPVLINDQTSGPVTDDTTTVWYGIHVNNSIPSGTYTATVLYTATATP